MMSEYEFAAFAIEDFINDLASAKPAPGGGAAGAISGANGAALVAMVANLTVGKEKYLEYEKLCAEVSAKATALAKRLLTLAQADSEAFSAYSLAAKLPRETDAQKSERTAKTDAVMKECASVPLSILKSALEGLKLCDSIVGKSNKGVQSDLFVGAHSLLCCGEGAAENVRVNLKYIEDESFVNETRGKMDAALKNIRELADKIIRATQS